MTDPSKFSYEVVWPSGKAIVQRIPARAGIPDLSGKMVAEVWSGLNRGEEIFPLLRERLLAHYPGMAFVEVRYPRGWDEKDILAGLPAMLRERRCDLAISGIGGSPGTTVAAVRASVELEKSGVPTVSIVASAYAPHATELARALGISHLPLAEYPGVFATDDARSLREKVTGPLYGSLTAAFKKPLEPAAGEETPGRRDIVMQGTLAEVQEFFGMRQWSDGLPVIPPTISEVERFLEFTVRPPEDVVAVIPVENREASIWNIAVNGMMAGCRPEYFPLLLAIVEAIADPRFRLEDVGGSVGWEPLVVLNGPIIKDLDFNSGSGALRVGRQANTSIGRFLRLFIRNVAGCRIAPAHTDKGATASGFNVVLAEDEDAADQVGWPPFSVDCGFRAGDDIVSVQSAISGGIPFYVNDGSALECAQSIAAAWGPVCAYWAWQGMFLGKSFPLLVLSRRIAAALAREGWTKDRLRTYLSQEVTVSARAVEDCARYTTGSAFSIAQWVADGRLPSSYCESEDADRLLPAFLDPACIGVVVAGDPLRNQARGFVNSSVQGARVSKPIRTAGKLRSWKNGRGRERRG